MAKRYRQRVEIGRDENGKPIYTTVEGHNQQEMLRKVALVLYEAGCLTEGATPVHVPEQEPVYFMPYAQKWKRLYKDGKKKHDPQSV